MFDAPVDTWYLTVGVALAGLAFAGVAADLPTHAPPDAAGAARSVDAAAAAQTATAEHPLSAERVRLGPRRIALRGDGGTARATFSYGPVTPVADGSELREVLRGADPSQVFASPEAFAATAAEARERDPSWERADEKLVVRTVTWEGVHVTLVDA